MNSRPCDNKCEQDMKTDDKKSDDVFSSSVNLTTVIAIQEKFKAYENHKEGKDDAFFSSARLFFGTKMSSEKVSVKNEILSFLRTDAKQPCTHDDFRSARNAIPNFLAQKSTKIDDTFSSLLKKVYVDLSKTTTTNNMEFDRDILFELADKVALLKVKQYKNDRKIDLKKGEGGACIGFGGHSKSQKLDAADALTTYLTNKDGSSYERMPDDYKDALTEGDLGKIFEEWREARAIESSDLFYGNFIPHL